MPYSEKKKEYNVQYTKNRFKRIPLDVQKEFYERVKAAATASGESINGYIKKAIELRMNNEGT